MGEQRERGINLGIDDDVISIPKRRLRDTIQHGFPKKSRPRSDLIKLAIDQKMADRGPPVRIYYRDRIFCVEELIANLVKLRCMFCTKYLAAGTVFIILPLVFDFTLFAGHIDYTQWYCLNTTDGSCSDATSGGLVYNRNAFCGLDPLDGVPSEVYASLDGNELNSEIRDTIDEYFVRDIHFKWAVSVTSSFPIKWSLYCESETNIYSEVFWYGATISGVFSGFVVDKFGRRSTLLSSAVFGSILGVAMLLAVSNNYAFLLAVRCWQGAIYTTYLISSYLWLGELIPRKYRALSLVLVATMVAVGRFLMAIFVSEISDWKYISIFILVLTLLPIPAIILLPESIQFLLSHHLDKQADRALSVVSEKWRVYSKALKLVTSSDISHREDAHFTALFTHKMVATRVLVILFLWAVLPLSLTAQPPSGERIVEYYVIVASATWLVQLSVLVVFIMVTDRAVLSPLIVLNTILHLFSIPYQYTALSVAVQASSEAAYIIVFLLTLEIVPMPQRGSVFGIGCSLRGAAAVVNIHWFNVDGGGDAATITMRSIITVLQLIAAALVFLLPSVRNNPSPYMLPFTIGEVRNKTISKTIIITQKQFSWNISEKTTSSSTPEKRIEQPPFAFQNINAVSSEFLEPPDPHNETGVCPPQSKTNLRYIMINDSVDRYIFLDKDRKQLDIQINHMSSSPSSPTRRVRFKEEENDRLEDDEKMNVGKNQTNSEAVRTVNPEPNTDADEHKSSISTSSRPFITVNIFKEQQLYKSYHKRRPSLVIECDSDSSTIHDVSVVEAEELCEMFQTEDQKCVDHGRRKYHQGFDDNEEVFPVEFHQSGTGSLSGSDLSIDSPFKFTAMGVSRSSDEVRIELEPANTVDEIDEMPLAEIQESSSMISYGSDEAKLEFDEVSLVSTDDHYNEPSTILKNFNSHMNAHSTTVSTSETTNDSTDNEKWRSKMRGIELKFDGENTDYIPCPTPEPKTCLILCPSDVIGVSDDGDSPNIPRERSLYYQDDLVQLFAADFSPVLPFFPLGVNFIDDIFENMSPYESENSS